MVYNPTTQMLQVVGIMSRGLDDEFTHPQPDFPFAKRTVPLVKRVAARLDMTKLLGFEVVGTIATAPGDECDFVSRFFAPGMGIPEADREKVFEAFFRASTAKQSGRRGTGLGLAFVKAIVDEAGGTCRAGKAAPRNVWPRQALRT